MRKYEVNINDNPYTISVKKYTSAHAELEINGELYSVDINGLITGVVDNTSEFAAQLSAPPAVHRPDQSAIKAVAVPNTQTGKSPTTGSNTVCAPIPGSILAIKVKEGDAVKTGQLLLKMEAMKMENEITANSNGTIAAIKVNEGDSVNQGDVLVEIN